MLRKMIEFCVRQLQAAIQSPYFPLVQEVALNNTDQALEQLIPGTE